MNRLGRLALLGGVTCAWLSASGCIARSEYDRVEYARRQAVAHRDELERDLADERARAMGLEKDGAGLQRELDTKTALADTLQAENERLDAIRLKLQNQLDTVLAKGVGDIQVVEVKLPPELDRALQDFAREYPDTIEYDAELGVVRWKSDLTFSLGSDKVRESVKQSLNAFANIVNSPAAEPFEVVVAGHTDNVRIGATTARKHPTNWHLSAHRAVSVMFALNKFGVDYERMGCMGYGEHRPRQENPARGGCEANRRVEVFLLARGEQSGGMVAMPTRTFSTSAIAKGQGEE